MLNYVNILEKHPVTAGVFFSLLGFIFNAFIWNRKKEKFNHNYKEKTEELESKKTFIDDRFNELNILKNSLLSTLKENHNFEEIDFKTFFSNYILMDFCNNIDNINKLIYTKTALISKHQKDYVLIPSFENNTQVLDMNFNNNKFYISFTIPNIGEKSICLNENNTSKILLNSDTIIIIGNGICIYATYNLGFKYKTYSI